MDSELLLAESPRFLMPLLPYVLHTSMPTELKPHGLLPILEYLHHSRNPGKALVKLGQRWIVVGGAGHSRQLERSGGGLARCPTFSTFHGIVWNSVSAPLGFQPSQPGTISDTNPPQFYSKGDMISPIYHPYITPNLHVTDDT